MADTLNNQTEPNTEPQGNGGQPEKTFTQDEVNRIISERLAKERAKAEPTEEEKRLADLTARENKLACKEYLNDKGYPVELLELFGTADSKAFEKNITRLFEIVPNPNEPLLNVAPTGTHTDGLDNKLLNIFKRN